MSGTCVRTHLLDANSASGGRCAIIKGRVACWDGYLPATTLDDRDDALTVRVGAMGEQCVVRRTGKAECGFGTFGLDAHKALGELDGVVDVASDAMDVLAVLKDGSVMRELRDPNTIERVGRIRDAIAVAATGSGYVVLTRGGKVWCLEDDTHSVTRFSGLDDIIDFATDVPAFCALSRDGRVACTDVGEMKPFCEHTPRWVEGITDAVAIGVGCAVLRDGSAVCWTADGRASDQPNLPPTRVDNVTDAAVISDTCIMRKNGGLQCWGLRDTGHDMSAGGEIPRAHNTPVEAAGVEHATRVAVGARGSAALLADGTVMSWGLRNRMGYDKRGLPMLVPGLDHLATIDATPAGPCGIDSEHTARCVEWGLPPSAVTRYAGLGDVKRIQLTDRSTLGVALVDGKVELFDAGQTLDGKTHSPAKRIVDAFGDVVDVALNGEVAGKEPAVCAVRASGKVACATVDASHAFDAKKPTPITVVELSVIKDAVQIIPMSNEFYARSKNGAVSGWEFPAPDKKPVHREETELGSLKGFTKISGEGLILCGLESSGATICQGSLVNLLGNNGAGREGYPPVTGLSDAVDIAGGYHSCAARKDGTVVCWGADGDDDLGDPAPAWSPVPIDIAVQPPARGMTP